MSKNFIYNIELTEINIDFNSNSNPIAKFQLIHDGDFHKNIFQPRLLKK